MIEISVTKVPKPEERRLGEEEFIVGWFPEPLLPIERRVLSDRGCSPNRINGQEGYFIEGSLGTLSYDEKEELRKMAMVNIKENPQERYLDVIGREVGDLEPNYS